MTEESALRRRLHRVADPALLAAAVAAVIVAGHVTRGAAPPQPADIGVPDTGHRTIAPNFAQPAGRTVVLPYRIAGRYEQAEIRLDGILLERRPIGAAERFLIVQIPHPATAGAHRLDLRGTTAIGSTTFFVG